MSETKKPGPGAGILRPASAIRAAINAAKRAGATSVTVPGGIVVRFNDPAPVESVRQETAA